MAEDKSGRYSFPVNGYVLTSTLFVDLAAVTTGLMTGYVCCLGGNEEFVAQAREPEN